MTLGRAPEHEDPFRSTRAACEARLPEKSIYRLLARAFHRLFPNEDFADLFEDVGRRLIPPRELVATRRVPKDALVAVETNRYPVPFEWVGQDVTVRILFEEVVLHGPDEQIVRHPKLAGRHQVARWLGEPRQLPSRKPPVSTTPS